MMMAAAAASIQHHHHHHHHHQNSHIYIICIVFTLCAGSGSALDRVLFLAPEGRVGGAQGGYGRTAMDV